MTFEEFKSNLEYHKTKVKVKDLNLSFDKTMFLNEKGYDIEAQEQYIEKLYYDNLEQLSKQ